MHDASSNTVRLIACQRWLPVLQCKLCFGPTRACAQGNLRMWKELKSKHITSRPDPMSMCEPTRIVKVPFRQWSTAAANEGASSSSSSGSGSGSSGGMIYPQVVVEHADIFAWAIGERPP